MQDKISPVLPQAAFGQCFIIATELKVSHWNSSQSGSLLSDGSALVTSLITHIRQYEIQLQYQARRQTISYHTGCPYQNCPKRSSTLTRSRFSCSKISHRDHVVTTTPKDIFGCICPCMRECPVCHGWLSVEIETNVYSPDTAPEPTQGKRIPECYL